MLINDNKFLNKIDQELYILINDTKFFNFNQKLNWKVKIKILFFRKKILNICFILKLGF